jgi:hypothetical protein
VARDGISLLGIGGSALAVDRAAQAQPQISLETYHQILDLIFTPAEEPIGSTGFALTVRLAPSFEPESQVNMTLLQDGTTRAEFIVAAQNVYCRCNDLLKAGVGNHADTLAKKNVVKRYPFNVSQTLLADWRLGFIQGLNPSVQILDSPQATVTLDADQYEVSYSRGLTDLRISFWDSGTPSALWKWAKAVHEAAQKTALQSSQ